MCFFVQTNHTRKELLFLMFKEINLRNHSSLHKLFYSLSKEFKQRTIEQAIFGNKPYLQLPLELGFKSIGMLNNWIREYKKNGYNVIIKQKGRPARDQRKALP
ncbi:IS3 family transposase, partial [Lactobacillus crispatus]